MKKFRLKFDMRTKALLVAMPFVAAFLLFYVLPFIASGFYAMTNNTIEKSFVGLNNFKTVISNQYFLQALSNTAKFTVISVPLLLVLAFLIACLLSASGKALRLFRSVFFVPILMPSAALVMFWSIAFSGNSAISGLIANINADLPLIAPVYIFFVWKNAGLLAIIIMSGMLKIPQEIIDAAKTDGAGTFKRHFYITLPLLSPVLFFSLVLGIVQSFKIFKEVYLLYGSYPHESLYFMQHYINNKFHKLDYGELSAGAIIFAGCILVFICAIFGVRKAWGRFSDNAR